MNRPAASMLVAVALVAGVACDQGTGPGTQWEPDLSSPQQFMLTDDPELFTGYGPYGPYVGGWAMLPDSFAAIHWIGTRVTIESDRGYRRERLIAPFACLLPSDDPYDPEFPYTFKWLACDGIGVITHERLTVQRREEFEELLGGVLRTYYEFQTMPGGSYSFRVDIGLDETEAAMDLARSQPEVDTTFHDTHTPRCIASRDYPPPPCPPWGFTEKIAFTFGEAAGDTVPVSEDGWIRMYYEEPDGRVRMGQYDFGEGGW